MPRLDHTAAITSLQAAKVLSRAEMGDELGQRLAKSDLAAALVVDRITGKVSQVSKADFKVPPRHDDIEKTLRVFRAAGVSRNDLNEKHADLVAASLVGYARGTAADHLNGVSAGTLNEMDYQTAAAEFFDGDSFDFNEWCSKNPAPDDEQGLKQ